jgi:hypothetical protein
MASEWPFDDPSNVAAISVRQVLAGEAAILFVLHDAEDGGWQFLTGAPPCEEESCVVALRRIWQLDPSIGALADLPPGWEAAIRAEPAEVGPLRAGATSPLTPPQAADPETFAVAHFATFALPATRDDFGAQAVEQMQTSDAFVALLEYAAEEADSALFANQGLPRRLNPRAFSPRQLQRTLGGQAGFQWFFNEGGRAFCLYVVLGDAGDAHRLVRKVEQVLTALTIEARR